ncbi:D-mannose binding lectin [compost metagenome]
MAIRYTPFQASGSPVLPPNQTMTPGQYLMSPNGRFRLVLQVDGNLVITDNGAVVWIADGNQIYSRTLYPKKMREPLMFVISNNGFLYDPSRRRLWIADSTHSIDKSLWYNTCMVIQDDGNLVIYDQRTGNLCWARFGFVPGRIPKPKERWVKVLPDGKQIYEWNFSLGPL